MVGDLFRSVESLYDANFCHSSFSFYELPSASELPRGRSVKLILSKSSHGSPSQRSGLPHDYQSISTFESHILSAKSLSFIAL